MPRIKAAAGLLTLALFCVGFNSARYPVVWDMVGRMLAHADNEAVAEAGPETPAPAEVAAPMPPPPTVSLSGSRFEETPRAPEKTASLPVKQSEEQKPRRRAESKTTPAARQVAGGDKKEGPSQAKSGRTDGHKESKTPPKKEPKPICDGNVCRMPTETDRDAIGKEPTRSQPPIETAARPMVSEDPLPPMVPVVRTKPTTAKPTSEQPDDRPRLSLEPPKAKQVRHLPQVEDVAADSPQSPGGAIPVYPTTRGK